MTWRLLKIWYDLIRRPYFAWKGFNKPDYREDYVCGYCIKPVLERYLYCSSDCSDADELRQRKEQ